MGEDALAAVGNSYEITLIFIAFAFGCNIGCSVVVSQLFGARQYSEMKTAVRTAMLGSAVLCLVLMVAGIFGSGTLLTLIHTPDNIFYDSKLYLDIYVWGLPFVFFYNISTGIFSALGDSKTPFWFLAASSTANIFVDILFVKAFGMGVAGVAWATFLCQGISCLLALLFVLRRLQSTPTGEKGELFSFAMLKSIAVIAIPSIMQQSFISVGNILIQSVINGFGSSVMAGYSAAIKLNNLVITSFTTLGNGISNYTAQNLGAWQAPEDKRGLSCRHENGMVAVYPAVPSVYVLWPDFGFVFHGRTLLPGPADRDRDSANPFPILLCYFGEAGGGWHPARHRKDEAIYGGNFYGSGITGATCVSSPQNSTGLLGHLVRVAYRLVDCLCLLRDLL